MKRYYLEYSGLWLDEITGSLVGYKVDKALVNSKAPCELYINHKLEGAVMGMGFLFDNA